MLACEFGTVFVYTQVNSALKLGIRYGPGSWQEATCAIAMPYVEEEWLVRDPALTLRTPKQREALPTR